MTPLRIANAPVNFGVYRPADLRADAGDLLAGLAGAGYAGLDAGPPGLFPPALLKRHGLLLAGGWIDLDADLDRDDHGRSALDAALDAFAALPADDPRFAPRPTLGPPPDPPRFARPGTPAVPPAGDWPRLRERVRRAAARCRARGLEPVLHHHLGTGIETEAEIDRALEETDVSLCLDTGHLLLAGGDPVAALRKYAGRVRQIHVKDASRDACARVRASGGDLWAAIRAPVFPRLGEGDLDLAAFAAALRGSGYTGWLVVEQDAVAPDPSAALADQRHNLARLGAALAAASAVRPAPADLATGEDR
ncbi:xylose isomerase [Bailinhaonella thermotolerans]|uniref:Xylose isomerase n=1 Tax=Bailinhaonella thermotolerans TaxID=1070861 RepID=A0A3A4B1I3_9ACTN|nr:xylose isomerase [Bailinhaonella thermotolerans]